MEDVRGLDEKFPNQKDSKDLAEILNKLLDHTTNKIMELFEQK